MKYTPIQMKLLRTALEMDQEQFAKLLGVQRETISRRESGKVAISPKMSNKLKEIEKSHDVTINQVTEPDALYMNSNQDPKDQLIKCLQENAALREKVIELQAELIDLYKQQTP